MHRNNPEYLFADSSYRSRASDLLFREEPDEEDDEEEPEDDSDDNDEDGDEGYSE
jgi:hypothetical protein